MNFVVGTFGIHSFIPVSHFFQQDVDNCLPRSLEQGADS